MKILALNSSPRVGRGSKTEMMLDCLVEGMRGAGAGVEVIHLRDKKIKNCVGCFSCWTINPGHCVLKDDMTRELFPKWLDSDMVIYATPLYGYAMNAPMKLFFDRIIPAIEPYFMIHENRVHHPINQKLPGAVMLSVAGMPDPDHFNAMSQHMNYTFASPGLNLVAEIYRPASESMPAPYNKEKKADILDAAVQAGRELVENGRISPHTMERVTQPLGDAEFFVKMANLFWKSCIAEKMTPETFREKKMVVRPDDIESFMITFPFGINKEAAGEQRIILQFHFSGEVQASCYFTIEKDHISSDAGTAEEPDITIDAPFEVWMDIMTRKADGPEMFMNEKYRVTGDLEQMIELFKKEEDGTDGDS